MPVTVGLRDSTGTVTPLGTSQANVSNLRAGASKNVPVKVQVPASLAPGSYELVVSIDPPAAFEDGNTENNAAEGKSVSAALANTDLTVAVGSNLTGTVAAGSTAQVRVSLTNSGNVPARATATVEVTATTGSTTTVLATLSNLRLNLQPGKTFSGKPVSVRLSGTPGQTAAVTLSARIASSSGLINDNPSNNTAPGVALSVQPPPPSPFTAVNPALHLAGTITFKRSSRVGALGNVIEQGTFEDSNGRKGNYDFRTTSLGVVNVGLVLTTPEGFPLLSGTFNRPLAVGGKTLVFSTDPAGSVATFTWANNQVLYVKYGR
ncbi:MAG: CARDB domain-containing protein [Tepidisphaerales bacterium]